MAGLLKTGNGARANSSNGASRWDSAAEASGRFAKVRGTRRRRLKLLLLLSGGTACKAHSTQDGGTSKHGVEKCFATSSTEAGVSAPALWVN